MMRSLVLFLATTLTACVSPPEPCTSVIQDVDGDGYQLSDDCDDSRTDVFPGAFEACDGIDNDCDGEVDEIYGDSDGDGVLDCQDEEVCDGFDNDGDTYIDEGFEDTDGDGLADCVDEDCTVELRDAGWVDVDEACLVDPGVIIDPWKMKTLWNWEYLSTDPLIDDVVSPPLIGQLDDDNGDGIINERDIPDVVFLAFSTDTVSSTSSDIPTKIVVLSGDDGSEKWAFGDPNEFLWTSGLALIDVDGDGLPNIVGVAFTTSKSALEVVAYEPDGTLLWRADTVFTELAGEQLYFPYVADLDGDGTSEILIETQVLDGVTGEQKFRLATATGPSYQQTSAADLDGDGTMEILYGHRVFSGADGSLLWSVYPSSTYEPNIAWSAVLQLDSDDEAEVLWIEDATWSLFEDDGTLISTKKHEFESFSSPCIADFDGDGEPEVGLLTGLNLTVYEIDGTPLWTPILIHDETDGLASCSAFDLDNDGDAELIYADQVTVKIFDGKTGALLAASGDHCSATGFEYPTLSDVNNDGSANILTVSQTFGSKESSTSSPCSLYEGGVRAFEHDGSGWAPTGQSWGLYTYRAGNHGEMNESLHSPQQWLDASLQHSRPVEYPKAADLTVATWDDCYTGCENTDNANLSVEITNAGSANVEEASLLLYAINGASRTELSSQTVGPIASGDRLADILLSVPITDVGSDGLSVEIIPLDTDLLECTYENNEYEMAPYCD